MDLAQKKCVACENGTSPFTKEQVDRYLRGLKTPWEVIDGKRIRKEFAFDNFASAIAFVNKVGGIAESEGHHPDIFLHDWNRVRIELTTFAIGGLSENDFILAAKIEALP